MRTMLQYLLPLALFTAPVFTLAPAPSPLDSLLDALNPKKPCSESPTRRHTAERGHICENIEFDWEMPLQYCNGTNVKRLRPNTVPCKFTMNLLLLADWVHLWYHYHTDKNTEKEYVDASTAKEWEGLYLPLVRHLVEEFQAWFPKGKFSLAQYVVPGYGVGEYKNYGIVLNFTRDAVKEIEHVDFPEFLYKTDPKKVFNNMPDGSNSVEDFKHGKYYEKYWDGAVVNDNGKIEHEGHLVALNSLLDVIPQETDQNGLPVFTGIWLQTMFPVTWNEEHWQDSPFVAELAKKFTEKNAFLLIEPMALGSQYGEPLWWSHVLEVLKKSVGGALVGGIQGEPLQPYFNIPYGLFTEMDEMVLDFRRFFRMPSRVALNGHPVPCEERSQIDEFDYTRPFTVCQQLCPWVEEIRQTLPTATPSRPPDNIVTDEEGNVVEETEGLSGPQIAVISSSVVGGAIILCGLGGLIAYKKTRKSVQRKEYDEMNEVMTSFQPPVGEEGDDTECDN